jgi:peptide/nickel transport system permease protein
MVPYVIRRLLLGLVTLFAVVTIVFFLLYFTGDPIEAILRQSGADPVLERALRHDLGLDQPLVVQYLHFLRDLLHGNFGNSIQYRTSTLELVMRRVPFTLQLASTAFAIAVLIAIPAGIASGVRPGGVVDTVVSGFVALFQATPNFVLGPLLILVLGVWIRALPVSGAGETTSWILPSATLALYPASVMTRILRVSVREIAGADFVIAARAKGLRSSQVMVKHILRNSSLPVLTVAGMLVSELVGGAVIVEAIFGWPGIGEFALQALENADFPIVRTVVILVAALVISINLLTDLLYAVIDRRVAATVRRAR